jgi:hypothetical protein
MCSAVQARPVNGLKLSYIESNWPALTISTGITSDMKMKE